MDKLTRQLHRDADRIEVEVSDELDRRIDASLRAMQPERATLPEQRRRPTGFWLASSLTGVIAATLIIAVFNTESYRTNVTPAVSTVSANSNAVPAIDWQAESAMLTEPLRQELEYLQSDFRKAEEKLKRDMGL